MPAIWTRLKLLWQLRRRRLSGVFFGAALRKPAGETPAPQNMLEKILGIKFKKLREAFC